MGFVNYSISAIFAVTVVAQGQVTYVVTMNTAPLISHPAAPFSLLFQLADGSGTGDRNNGAVISNFQFGTGGSAIGAPQLFGGASGNLSSTIILVDSGFPNLFKQSFSPGTTLTFEVSLSCNSDSGDISDQFIFSILDHTGTPIPTPYGAPLDAFLSFDVGSLNSTVKSFSSDPARSPLGGGGPIISINAPSVVASESGCAADITSQFQIAPDGFRYDHDTQQFVQSVTLQGVGTNLQPLSFVLDNMTTASLFNKDGNTICTAPLNSPYINVPPGTTTVTLLYNDPTMTDIKYTARVLVGSGVR